MRRAQIVNVLSYAVGLTAIVAICFALGLLSGCKEWTAQDTKVAVDVSSEILCAIEHAELSDPSLDALCAAKGLAPEAGADGQPVLSAPAKRAVKVVRAKAQARSACPPVDAGAP